MENSVAIIWDNDKKVGYCNTLKEADDICKINNNLNWSKTKCEEKVKDLMLLTINDFKSEKLIENLYEYDKNQFISLMNILFTPVKNSNQVNNTSCIHIKCSEVYPMEYSDNLSLKYIIIEDGITNLMAYSFTECHNLKYISIPKSVFMIEGMAFSNNYKLETINISDNHPCLYIGPGAFKNCHNLKNINIPNNNNLNINENENENIIYYDSSNMFGDSTFEGCYKLSNINIPNNIKYIGENVFKDCTSLININIPKNVKSISHNSFDNCHSLKTVTIEEGLESLGDEVFKDCSSLSSIKIPNSVTWIGNNVFSGCINLTSITIPKRFESEIKDIIDLNLPNVNITYT